MLIKQKFSIIFVLLLSTFLSNLSGQVIRDTSLQIDYKFFDHSEVSKIWVDVRDGMVFFEDDILLGQAKDILRKSNSRSATISPISSASRLWTDNIVPFDLPASHPERSAISQAITHVMSRTNLTFVPRTTEVNYIKFVSGQDGCFSSIGMIGGEQTINMSGNCGVGAGIHEIGHAIGLFHEHTRKDRDNYVNILWDNIIGDQKSNFQKYNEIGFRGVDFDDYDYNSIMHYFETTFSLNGQPTITIKSPPAKPGTTLGNSRLSPIDILSINNLYRILPRPTAEIELASELATSSNPICNSEPFDVLVSIQNYGQDTTEGIIQVGLHDKNTGQNIAMLGNPIAYTLADDMSNLQWVIQVDSINIAEGEYLMALWKVDEEGKLLEMVRDGAFLNGKEIFVSASCNVSSGDIYEFNDNSMAAHHFEYPQNDTLVVISTEGSTIHTNADIDYYTFTLPGDINYFVDINLQDAEDGSETIFSNDVVVSHRKKDEAWTTFRNSLFEPTHILNGGTLEYRIKSHFPGDTGSYLLNLQIGIDTNPMLELTNRNAKVGPEDSIAQIIIMSNRSWSVSNSEDWASPSISEGFGYDTITVRIKPNESFDERITRFTVQNLEEDLSAEFALTQEGIQRMLAGELRNVIVCNEDSKAIIFVESNTDWIAFEDEPWMDIIKSDGSLNDYIEINLSVNLVGQTRSGTITLETTDQQFANTIRVFQPSRNDINACVDPVIFEVSPDAGSVQFEVMTDQNWTIESDESWINNISLLEGNTSETITVDYDELMDTADVRQARIKVIVENIGILNLLVFQGSNFTSSSNDLELIFDDHLVVYPNPFEGRIFGRIFQKTSSDMMIKILDVQGQTIAPVVRRTFNAGWNDFDIDTESLRPGMYLIHITSESSSGTKRVIKF